MWMFKFESQARLALTLSHFLSSFSQIVNPAEDFPLRQAELELTKEQLIGEVLAAAGGDYKVVGVGIFFDRGKFLNYRLPYFGPYAFRLGKDINRKYTVVDWAGLPDAYENEIWVSSENHVYLVELFDRLDLLDDEGSMGNQCSSIGIDRILAEIIYPIGLCWKCTGAS